MKKIAFLAAFSLAAVTLPAGAFADPAARAAPAPAPAHYTSTDTTIGTLLADPAAKAVVEKHFPGLTTSDQIAMASDMTLRQIQQFKPDVFTGEALAAVDADLAKLPVK